MPCVPWRWAVAAHSLCAVCTVTEADGQAVNAVAEVGVLPLMLHWRGWVCGKGECNDGLAYQLLQAFCRLV